MLARTRFLGGPCSPFARDSHTRGTAQTGTGFIRRLRCRRHGVATFASLHGSGNLTALAFEFSPSVEATGADTVTFDVSGLDRLFGLPQEVASAIARRARETGAKASVAVAANPDAAICAARGFCGTSVIPYGDESKFLESLPLSLLA